MGKVITYECDTCGCEVVVTEATDTQLSPLYCCGAELQEVSCEERPARPKKKTVKKAVKKTVKKAVKKVAKAAPKKAVKKAAKKK